jgi:1-acyl-sn-glycerol-3-phosphate acyltransferase
MNEHLKPGQIPPDSGAVRQLIGRVFLKLARWRIDGNIPASSQMVVIAAPHTTNWDFIYLIAAAFCFRLKINWMGKDSLFSNPFGFFMRWMGGIAIDRSRNTNLVSQLIETMQDGQPLAVVIPPSGTRRKTEFWKSGFYRIAEGAKIPIVCGFLDYDKKVAGMGLTLTPSGDIRADMDRIRGFYKDIRGKYPQHTDTIRLREELEE